MTAVGRRSEELLEQVSLHVRTSRAELVFQLVLRATLEHAREGQRSRELDGRSQAWSKQRDAIRSGARR